MKKLTYKNLLLILSIFISTLTFSKSINEYKVSLNFENTQLSKVFKTITEQTELGFSYLENELNSKKEVSITCTGKSLDAVLAIVVEKEEFNWTLNGKTITIKKKPAKPIQVTGVVKDDLGNPMPGANIVVKGTTIGTVSDLEGKYELNVPNSAKDILLFSSMGYLTQEIRVEGKAKISIDLVEDAVGLQEVVVIGYGTQRKADLTGSVASVSTEELTKRNTANVSTALQGTMAGVTVTRNGSGPGAASSIKVRGITTLQGSSDPLVLVDDVPVESIDDVNPDEIESINILKDGASAAIYGSRAAAGVILITTKRAKQGKLTVSYSGDVSFNTPTRKPETVGTVRFMEMWNEMKWNDGADEFGSYTKDVIDNYAQLHADNPDQYPDTDWGNLLVDDYSKSTKHNISFSAGTEMVSTRVSLGFDNQDALYDHKEWNRYTVRLNNTIKFNKYFNMIVDASYKYTESESPLVNPIPKGHKYPGLYPAVWQNGNYASGKSGTNMYAMLHEGGYANSKSNKVYSKFGFNITPLEGLKISFNFAPAYVHSYYKRFQKQVAYWESDNQGQTGNPSGYMQGYNTTNLKEERGSSFKLTNQALVDYKFSLGKSNFYALAGYEQYSTDTEELKLVGKEYEYSNYPYLNQAPKDNVYDDGSSISEVSYRSYFGRLTYNYDHKYLLQANFRRDGSSRFGPDYRWGNFPSISLGWVVTEEKFMAPVKKYVPFLKLRASYGELGNDRLGNYLYTSVMQITNAVLYDGNSVASQKAAAQRFTAIEDITWETTKSYNYAVDMNFLDNRLSTSFEYYQKKTTDMLLDLSVPKYSGAEDPTTNVGDMETKGWEFVISWNDKIGDLKYSASFNISDYESIIGDVKGKRLFDGSLLSEEGIEYKTRWGYLSDGLILTDEDLVGQKSSAKIGDVKYRDISGPDGEPDGIISADDQTHIGGTLPKLLYGGNISLEYKGIDFSVAFQGVGERNSYVSSRATNPFDEGWMAPPTLIDGNYWSQYNTDAQNAAAEYPRLSKKSNGDNYKVSDFWIIDGSYFRLKNITLGYTLPINLVKPLGLNSLRFYVAGNDLFSIDEFPEGWDPEQGSDSYLITKSFNLGLKLKF
jgi:TonB-linked SusC/RagA family outer membrane protein